MRQPDRTGKKFVGFRMKLSGWTWMGSQPRDFDPGDIAWLSEEEYWYLKTTWPDHIFDLTPAPVDAFRGVFK